jgi:hypothetical protein
MKISTPVKMLVIAAALLFTTNVRAQENRDTVVTVPSTGYLPLKPSQNFTGTNDDVLVTSFSGSSTKGINFNTKKLSEGVFGSSVNSGSAVILVAQPGNYTLTLTDAAVTANFFSTTVFWVYEPCVAYKKGRMLYKFVNTADKVGFQRDETYASDNYQSCTMGEGENIYAPFATKNIEKAAELLNTTVADLTFIPWSKEVFGAPLLSDITTDIQNINLPSDNNAQQFFNLAGQKVNESYKGIIIKNGRKYIK